MTLGTQWAWKPDDQLKSAADVIGILAQCAGGDGNLLLDVGPEPDGRIEPRQVDILKQVGAWLSQNGDSIYGTRGGPWKPSRAIASTRKGKTIFLHVLQARNTVELPGITRKITSATRVDGTRVAFTQSGRKKSPSPFPRPNSQSGNTVIEIEVERLGHGAFPPWTFARTSMPRPPACSRMTRPTTARRWPLMAISRRVGPPTKTPGRPGSPSSSRIPGRFAMFRFSKPIPYRVQKFEFQYRDGDAWKTIFTGTTLGANYQKSFSPVTAREFRLNILDATEGPTISEMELF